MAAAGPTHYQAFFVEVQLGRWSPQPRRLRAPAGIHAPEPSLHPVIALLSPGGALTQRHACGFKGKEREWGG